MSTNFGFSAVTWYWNRLRCMSLGELGHRLHQKVTSRLQSLGLGRARWVSADASRVVRSFAGRGTHVTPDLYIQAADELLAGKLKVFDREYGYGPEPDWNRDPKTGTIAPLAYGKTLNYRDESVVGDIKYLWEPNRHLHVVTLAQAYHQSGEQRYLEGLRHQLESWLDQCPYLKGPNWTSSLELAIRLINWSIVWQLTGGIASPMFAGPGGGQFRENWLRSIYQHMHFIRGHLSRFSSANNHLIGELSGLFVGCVTWPFWPDTARWQQVAKAGLEREALLQNAPDGVNHEQAISYQQFVLDFLLLAGLAGHENDDAFSQPYWQRIESMLEFLASVMDVHGNVPMIGDADDGYAVRLSQEAVFCPYRSLLATGAVLFKRGDFKAKAVRLDDKTRWLLGAEADATFSAIPADIATHPVRREFREGGYFVLGSDFETAGEIRMIADAGPLGYLSIAAHGHADALAFTLSVGGREFLIDPGTYAYHTQKKWRDYFRGTAAHNTVVVDGENQSEIGGNFMWLRKANAVCESFEAGLVLDRFVGSHDGYRRLSDPVVHRREIMLEKTTRRIAVTDILDCTGQHRAECRWHFSEACEVWLEDSTLYARNDGIDISLRFSAPDLALKIGVHKGEENPPCGWVSRGFDVKIPAVTAVVRFAVHGQTTLVTEIDCGLGSTDGSL
jgi:hypothetical protein